jgi:hypothetical protein
MVTQPQTVRLPDQKTIGVANEKPLSVTDEKTFGVPHPQAVDFPHAQTQCVPDVFFAIKITVALSNSITHHQPTFKKPFPLAVGLAYYFKTFEITDAFAVAITNNKQAVALSVEIAIAVANHQQAVKEPDALTHPVTCVFQVAHHVLESDPADAFVWKHHRGNISVQ